MHLIKLHTLTIILVYTVKFTFCVVHHFSDEPLSRYPKALTSCLFFFQFQIPPHFPDPWSWGLEKESRKCLVHFEICIPTSHTKVNELRMTPYFSAVHC